MKRTVRAHWAPLTALALVLALVLVFLYRNMREEGEAAYLKNQSMLRQIRQVAAQSDVDVLKSKIGLIAHYDPLTTSTAGVTNLLDRFDAELSSQSHRELPAIAHGVAALRDVVLEKDTLVERFKSSNSVLHNSLAFLPLAAEDVEQAIFAIDLERTIPKLKGLSNEVKSLLLSTMLYSQSASPEKRAEIDAAVTGLQARGHGWPMELRERLDIFCLHAKAVLREQGRVNQLLVDILQLPIHQRITAVTDALNAEEGSVSQRSQRYRGYLVVYSGSLMALLLFFAVRLMRSHTELRISRDKLVEHGHTLEQRVADRVAELKDSERRMTQLAQFDSLTGLPNRNLFRDRLSQAMIRADRDRQYMALMFVDLDHFKQINDSLGHVVGDEVLKAVAQRLRGSLREVDSIARIGGDEFTIIVEGLTDSDHALHVAVKIKAALSEPLLVAGRDFLVSASIGIAIYPFGSGDGDALLQAADIAMYQAKESGRNAFALFAPEMAVQISERATMEHLLRRALGRNEFALVYQPKLDLHTGRIIGVEALLRWHSQELGSVSPATFIPLAEEMGLIVSIGEWALRTACMQGISWHQQGLPALSVAVNLSPRQLHDPGLIDRITNVLRESRFPAELLELELTEGVLMEDVKGNIETLFSIRALGVSLAVDDFGTGYSSLAYLARLPIQTLKIDRAFITPMNEDPTALTLVSTMVTLAHSLKLKVVAEGVETLEQQRALVSMDCDQIQGYFFSRPVAAEVLADLLRAEIKSLRQRQTYFSQPDLELTS